MEYQGRKMQREKKARERLKSDELKALKAAEEAKLKEEQDKMKTDMDKFFDSSGSVVSAIIISHSILKPNKIVLKLSTADKYFILIIFLHRVA